MSCGPSSDHRDKSALSTAAFQQPCERVYLTQGTRLTLSQRVFQARGLLRNLFHHR